MQLKGNLGIGLRKIQNSYLNPAIENGLIRMALPDKATSKVGLYVNLDIGHLHSNESCKGTYEDSHQSFDKYLDYRRIIKMAQTTDTNMIIESVEEPLHNVSLLFEKRVV